MDTQTQAIFRERVWDYYHQFGRDLVWRHDPTPYQVLVSEVMLQQTQVARVQVKYDEWMSRFPTLEVLALASVSEVLASWQGLGYNRRGLWLHRAAQIIHSQYEGVVPSDPGILVTLPGIGPNSAGSIAAFAYDVPVVFIETNIRRVYLHEFFPNAHDVSDAQLRPLIEATLDREFPREWYYALMDYGSHLGVSMPNPNHRSKAHRPQSKFEGSSRQVRGAILRQAIAGPITPDWLAELDVRATDLASVLLDEGFLTRDGLNYKLAT
jgi:A/G-specific adenine glycosylase